MPCRSDYLEPTSRERALQHAAQLMIYVLIEQQKAPPKWLQKDAQDIYCRSDRAFLLLCKTLREMLPEKRDALVYNARSRMSRKLADWWEEHEAQDKARAKKEKEEQERAKLKASAIAKLTKEEQWALGL